MEFDQQSISVHQPPPSPSTTTTISNENLLFLQNDKINHNELGKPVSESISLETQLEQPPVEDEIAPSDVVDVEKPGGELTDSVAGADLTVLEKSGGELTDSVAGADVADVEKSGGDLTDSVPVSDVAGMEKDVDGCELTHSVAGDDVVGVEMNDGGDELTDSVAGDDGAAVEKHDGGSCDVLTDSVTVVGEHEEVMTDSIAIENFEKVGMEENVGARKGVTESEEKEKMDRHLESDDDDDAEEETTMSDDDEDEKVERKMPVKRRGRPAGTGKRRWKSPKATPKSTARVKMIKEEEEDVCFICYDGGELVLCDKRNCPKAYHISCINRDEAFFQSKGKWNCGPLLIK